MPRLPEREAQFLSTPSARRATRVAFSQIIHHTNFYPRPPRGGRQAVGAHVALHIGFLSTPSARRATFQLLPVLDPGGGFLSTPSARRATTGLYGEMSAAEISIHALREEGDSLLLSASRMKSIFLSTPSARRATGFGICAVESQVFLSTPSARRATD